MFILRAMQVNDSLIENEVINGQVFHYEAVQLKDYGYYLIYPDGALDVPAQQAFRDWIMATA